MASSRVYVGNLPMDIRTREVEDIFYKYGRIRDIDIKFPSRPPAFAFVDFDDPRDAEDAIDGRNGYDYDGNRLRVEAANASSKRSDPSKPKYPRNVRGTGEFAVDVSRLPSRMSWQDLKDYMRKAGDVVFTSVDGRGHGFVEYSNRSDMKYALDKLDDTAIRFKGDKVYIRVKPARSSSRSRSRSRSRSPRSSKKSRSRKRSYSRSRSRSVSGSRSRSRSPRKSSSKKSRRDKDDEKRSTSRSPSKDRVRDDDDAVADQGEETKERSYDGNGKKSDDAPPSAATDHQTASKPDWTVLKVDDLREKLSTRGLDTTGERDELIERLKKSDDAAAESEPQEQAAKAQQ